MEVNIREAKSQLSKLIDWVQMGDEVIIVKAGKPVAKLVRIGKPAPREFGSAKGEITFHDGWNEPLSDAEIVDIFGV
jgi:prevent-host-death family protein